MKNNKKKTTGFTLIEIMAVVLIIGLLLGIAAKNFMGKTDQAKVITTRANLKGLHHSVLQFKMDTGRYPTEEEGLLALIEQPDDVTGWEPGGYLETTEVPLDSWKRELVYQLNPESGKAFVIISYGADGEEDGGIEGDENLGYDADLYSTDAN